MARYGVFDPMKPRTEAPDPVTTSGPALYGKYDPAALREQARRQAERDRAALAAAQAPVITRCRPGRGPAAGGSRATVFGERLSGATSVVFGGVAAPAFTLVNDTAIVCLTPAGVGPVDVVIVHPLGDVALAAGWTYD